MNGIAEGLSKNVTDMGSMMVTVQQALSTLSKKDEPPLEVLNNIRKTKHATALGLAVCEIDNIFDEIAEQPGATSNNDTVALKATCHKDFAKITK